MTDIDWGDERAARFYGSAKPTTPPTPSAVPPTDTASAPADPAFETLEQKAERFYRPEPPPPETPKADSPTVPTTDHAVVVADLAKLGVTNPEGSNLTPEAFVALHDKVIAADRAGRDAEIASWEATSRREIPAQDITAAERFAATLDADVRDVLASSGLGSHPAIVKLAAKLSRVNSR